MSYTEGGDGRTGVVNVSARAYDDLKQRRVGYYGDTPTGAPVSGTERPRPQIQNGEKLLVTWNDCEPAGSMGMNISYTLKILPSDGKGAPYLELSNILLSKTPMLPGGQQTLITRTPVYDQNGSMTGEVTENLLSHSLTYDIDKNEFTLVLDELVGKDGGVSIFEAYPTIPSGNIMAVVEVRAAGSPTQKGQSNVEHSYYASEAVTQEETVRRVANLRHFNNVRYGAADYRYLQTADFTWRRTFSILPRFRTIRLATPAGFCSRRRKLLTYLRAGTTGADPLSPACALAGRRKIWACSPGWAARES